MFVRDSCIALCVENTNTQKGRQGFQPTHGLRKRPEYAIWNGIKQRCHNPNVSGFKKYGARGIVMCDEWRNSFEAFFRDVGPRPSPHHSVERVDNDGPYAAWNCRWATIDEQANNKRRTIRVNGKTIAEIARETGLEMATIRARYYRGDSPDRVAASGHLERQDLGTLNKGSGNGQSKITEDIVRDIRKRIAHGEAQKDIAADIGVSRATISAISRRVRWGWLD